MSLSIRSNNKDEHTDNQQEIQAQSNSFIMSTEWRVCSKDERIKEYPA
jgi:hypothetical protein